MVIKSSIFNLSVKENAKNLMIWKNNFNITYMLCKYQLSMAVISHQPRMRGSRKFSRDGGPRNIKVCQWVQCISI